MKLVLLILVSALVTAFISGVFGMAGGMIFMGIVASVYGVTEAMVIHGAVQSLSNSHRAYLLRVDIRWDIIRHIALGSIPAVGLLLLAGFVPQKGVLFLVLGLLPLLLWLPRGWLAGDAANPFQAMLCGFFVMGLNLVAGVAGPALDVFFVKTSLTRKEIVATKAVTMFGSHLVKIGYFGLPLFLIQGSAGLPPFWVFIAVLPCVMIGTFLGTRLLHRFSDIGFRSYTKYLVSMIGIIYIGRGLSLLGGVELFIR